MGIEIDRGTFERLERAAVPEGEDSLADIVLLEQGATDATLIAVSSACATRATVHHVAPPGEPGESSILLDWSARVAIRKALSQEPSATVLSLAKEGEATRVRLGGFSGGVQPTELRDQAKRAEIARGVFAMADRPPTHGGVVDGEALLDALTTVLDGLPSWRRFSLSFADGELVVGTHDLPRRTEVRLALRESRGSGPLTLGIDLQRLRPVIAASASGVVHLEARGPTDPLILRSRHGAPAIDALTLLMPLDLSISVDPRTFVLLDILVAMEHAADWSTVESDLDHEMSSEWFRRSDPIHLDRLEIECSDPIGLLELRPPARLTEMLGLARLGLQAEVSEGEPLGYVVLEEGCAYLHLPSGALVGQSEIASSWLRSVHEG